MKFAIFFLLLISCESVDRRLQEVAVPVSEAQRIGQAVVTALPQADLDQDGKVPSSLEELIALFNAIRRSL